MVQKKRVLIYPAGSEGAINIYNSLRYNIHFELFGASMVSNHAKMIYDDNHYYEGDLNIKSINFFKNFKNLLKKFKIDYIICTHDEVITFLLKNQNKINAILCSSPYETAKIAENKKLTARTFKGKYYMPKVYNGIKKIKFPVFLKPYIGAGGKGTKKIDTVDELNDFMKNKKNILFF